MISYAAAIVGLATAQTTTIFDLQEQVAQAMADVEALTNGVATQDGMAQVNMDSFSATIDSLLPSIDRIQQLVDDIDGMDSDLAGVQTDARDAIAAMDEQTANGLSTMEAALEAQVSTVQVAMEEKVDERKAAIKASTAAVTEELGDRVGEVEEKGKVISDALSVAHFADPKTPVMRYMIWHNYCNSVGWMQGNEHQGYGGRHPSQWGDSNTWAHDMNEDLKYIKRLFNKEIYGDKFGMTVCAESWEMPHSTDDKRCGAIARIRNTNSGNTNWRVDWSFSGWCGWGNRASTALNRRNVWGGCCHGICQRTDTYTMKPGEVNTVAWIAGGTHPYGHYNHYRMVFLSFNNLDLPNGLEFVDDFDTMSGSWKI
jgi:hypothetical protein